MSKMKETGRKAGFLQTGLMMLIGAIIGGGGSMLFFLYGEPLRESLKRLAFSIFRFSSIALIILSICSCLISTFLVLKARKKHKQWDGEEEEQAEQIAKSYELYQAVMSFLSVFGICLSGIVISDMYRNYSMANNCAILCFAAATLWILFAMDRMVKYRKKLNPEKKGNIFSWNYDKEWLASCEERERMQVFRAGYAVYVKSNILYLIIFICLILTSVIFDLGIAPFLVLLVIWYSQILMFTYYSRKRCMKGEE